MPILAKKKIIFSDKAHFDLGGYVNKPNFRIWTTKNPHAYIEKSIHPKLGFSSRGISGPFFFEKEHGVNDDRCWALFNEFLFIKFEEEIISNTAEATLDVLCPVFEDRIIGRKDVVWWLRSCDLKTLDYYLSGVVKEKYYADKPETIDVLKDNIREAIGEIQLHTIDNMFKKWADRVGYYMASLGSHLNEIVFRY